MYCPLIISHLQNALPPLTIYLGVSCSTHPEAVCGTPYTDQVSDPLSPTRILPLPTLASVTAKAPVIVSGVAIAATATILLLLSLDPTRHAALPVSSPGGMANSCMSVVMRTLTGRSCFRTQPPHMQRTLAVPGLDARQVGSGRRACCGRDG